MKMKFIRTVTVGLVALLLMSGLTFNVACEEKIETSVVLIRVRDPSDIWSIKGEGAKVIHGYHDHILVEASPPVVSRLKDMGFTMDTMEHRTRLNVNGYEFDIRDGDPDIPDELRVEGYRSGVMGQYIVHMLGPIATGWRQTLERMDVEVLNYVHNYAYRVRMTPEQAKEVSGLQFVDWVGVYHPYYKIQVDMEPGVVYIGMVPGTSRDSLKEVRDVTPILSFTDVKGEGYRFMSMVQTKEMLYELANINDVSYIIEYNEPVLHAEIDSQMIGGGAWYMDDDGNPSTPYRAHGSHGAYMNQLGYTGAGVTVAVADTGLGDGTTPDAGHADFTGRVIGGYYWSPLTTWADEHSHGTHCTGSIAGDTYAGTEVTYAGHGPYYASQGLAYNSQLYGIRIFDDTPNWSGPGDYFKILEVAKQEADAYVHSNSWGANTGGAYYLRDNSYDRAVRDADRDAAGNQPMVVTVAAGNDGADYDDDWNIIYYQTINSPGNAKNVITVGATESYMPDAGSYGYQGHINYFGVTPDNPDNMIHFSSRGWTADNRIKPDVVAPGYGILSTLTPEIPSGNYTGDNRYEWKQGTSMSTPAVAGAAAVTVEWYEENHGTRPSPAMVKALLINTANDMDDATGNTGPIPNRDEGWGMVDISKLERPYGDPVPFFLIDQKTVFTDSLQEEEYVVKPDRLEVPLRFSLVWTDKEAPSGTGGGRTLVNNLDLEVESPSGRIYRGNAFSGGWTQAGTDTMGDFDYSGDGWDDTNNVENVYIHPEDVEPGVYTVRVVAKNIADDGVKLGYNSQDYALVVYNANKGSTPEDPYLIYDVHDLQNMTDDITAHYALANDIDANETREWNWNGSAYNGFEPVGTGPWNELDLHFTGSFDGRNYNITGLYINRSDADHIGLFGFLGPGGEVRNVGIVDAEVNGDSYVGALVGRNREGNVSNCHATGVVSGERNVGALVGDNRGAVWNSYATGDVNGDGSVGGLIGGNYGTVFHSHATGDVIATGSYSYAGGLTGYNGGMVENSYATGNVSGEQYVGGLTGRNDGTLSNSSATGHVRGQGDVGGLVGHSTSGGTVSNSSATGSVNGITYVGGLVGQNSGSVETSNATGDVSGDYPVAGLVGWNYGTVSRSYARGNVTGNSSVGGLVGYNSGAVWNSYARGYVTGKLMIYTNFGGFVGRNDRGKIINCYSTGSVHYADAEDPTDKGFAGRVDTGGNYEMTGNFWDVETSGQNETEGNATGRNTVAMKTRSTFTDAGWDFDEIWYMEEGITYPLLRWQEPPEPPSFCVDLFAYTGSGGWNFVSFNIEVADTSLVSILSDIEGSYDMVMWYDAARDMWCTYVPGRPEHFNGLDRWDHTMGIWIKMNTNETLIVTGDMPTSTGITLHPGWNMVGLPSGSAGNHDLPAEVTKIAYFDIFDEYNLAYDHDPANFTFNPGHGYWVHNGADGPMVWTVEY